MNRAVLPGFCAALCVALFAFAACSTPTALPRGGGAAGGPYLIQPNDLLLITFAGEPDYNQQVRVDWQGSIDLPALTTGGPSSIRAAGLTPAILAERVTEFGRTNKILASQRAQVFVSEYAAQHFVLLGQVAQPGRYAFPRGLPPRMGLEEAIATGGGYTRLARQSAVKVKRGREVFKVDLHQLATGSGAEPFTVLPGDVITVGERLF